MHRAREPATPLAHYRVHQNVVIWLGTGIHGPDLSMHCSGQTYRIVAGRMSIVIKTLVACCCCKIIDGTQHQDKRIAHETMWGTRAIVYMDALPRGALPGPGLTVLSSARGWRSRYCRAGGGSLAVRAVGRSLLNSLRSSDAWRGGYAGERGGGGGER